MGEENPLENNRVKSSSKFSDENQVPKGSKPFNNNSSKSRSLWGSQIVKGFSSSEKKTTKFTLTNKKEPLTITHSNQKINQTTTVKRTKSSLVSDLSCSVNATKVHPQQHQQQRRNHQSNHVFVEIDQLRSLLQESKEREAKLQTELSDCRKNQKAVELELKRNEIDSLVRKVDLLECEKTNLSQQLSSLTMEEDCRFSPSNNLELDVLELRRVNNELHLQKRNLSFKLSSMQSQLAALSERDNVEKIKAEASLLRQTNEDLCKQVEGLQMSRLNEVEELVYLRWINSCLRNELRNSLSSVSSDATSNSRPCLSDSTCLSSFQSNDNFEHDSSTKRLSLINKMKKWPPCEEDVKILERSDNIFNLSWLDAQSPGKRHSIGGSKCSPEDLIPSKRRQSDGFMCSVEVEKEPEPIVCQKYDLEATKLKTSFDVEKRVLRIPNPPPRPSCTISSTQKEVSAQILPPPPPPPPPPPKFISRNTTGTVQRAPQVVELYHSLMRRDSKKDSLNGGICDASDVANVRNSMIGEIENRSSHLLAIKEDVETQAEFVNSLIREVNNAVYPEIEDVVAFVKWLDDELCFLVDERAVLKHFDWPEKKADTLREAAFGYRDIKKLEHEISNYKDDSQVPCDIALKKMVALSEKMERTVYSLIRTRDSLMRHCKEFQIPTEWMLDDGILSKIKFGSVKLAKKYMKRVAVELQSKGTSEKDSSMDYMLLQGVRFAFRIHQFAGGFDAETMHAFEELRNLALVLNKK